MMSTYSLEPFVTQLTNKINITKLNTIDIITSVKSIKNIIYLDRITRVINSKSFNSLIKFRYINFTNSRNELLLQLENKSINNDSKVNINIQNLD